MTDYVGCLFEDIDAAQKKQADLREQIPDYLRNIMTNQNEIRDNFVKYIDLEKVKVRENMSKWLKEIEMQFSVAVQDVSKYLDTQCQRFEKNLEFFLQKTNESFALNDLPTQSDILQN